MLLKCAELNTLPSVQQNILTAKIFSISGSQSSLIALNLVYFVNRPAMKENVYQGNKLNVDMLTNPDRHINWIGCFKVDWLFMLNQHSVSIVCQFSVASFTYTFLIITMAGSLNLCMF